MTAGPSIDGVLVQWGERLFYPRNRIVRGDRTPRLTRLDVMTRRKAAFIRKRIDAIVVRRAPQVMVKIVGGGRGMRAIRAHFNYISRDGSLELEDDRGVSRLGKEALRDLADQWRYGGSLIKEVADRNEAVYVTLSMPHGTKSGLVLKAAREFARAELPENRYVMVLHEQQANPHVHLTVRAESMAGERLQTWAERHRWRETFAEKLRGCGVDAEATPQVARGENRTSEPLWRAKGKDRGTVREAGAATKSGQRYHGNRMHAMQCWVSMMSALQGSQNRDDRRLAKEVAIFLRNTPFAVEVMGPLPGRTATLTRDRDYAPPERGLERVRPGPEWTR